ncbi:MULTISPECIES: FAD-dependent oxidoreductase [Niastella]|uniref:Flavin-dependent monooxygenase n=1 Tax=Niastella soli TaxID=2821487 RepID=A0ABS3YVN4_9BACT|nr:NAD(P)/FAD-dependent oxidoreductase [Niastella soli]MBO9201938.1 FAD-dependent monooxygenase [Niastella soli]
MLLQNKQVAIVGGGPGGLSTARLLQIKGAQVTVYERDVNQEARVQGATLDLHEESGLEALRRAGLIDAFYSHHRPDAGKLRLVDKHAVIMLDDHTAETAYAEDRPEIDRGPLRKILMGSLKPGTIVWDSQFVSMDKHQEGWVLHFRNGQSAYADVVIAADGANSSIRPYLTSIQPVYSGVTIVEGNLYHAAKHAPALNDLVKGGKVFAFGDEQSLILSAKGDGCLSFYTGCKVPETWMRESGIDFTSRDAVRTWFMSAFGTWDPVWQELFASDELYFIPRPQYHYPLDQTWPAHPNLTMLGDAAHRMPPYAGEGVNMAMQDAFELADCLTSDEYPDLQTAIEVYEKQMRLRAMEITRVTLENTALLHATDALDNMVAMMQG